MIFVLIILIPIIIATLFFITKKVYSIEKKVSLRILILNIALLIVLRMFLPSINFSSITILFWIAVLINIILLVLLLNSKIVLNKKTAIILVVAYFVCMLLIPAYKYEDHEHTFTSGFESINTYSNYYNCYGIKLKRVY